MFSIQLHQAVNLLLIAILGLLTAYIYSSWIDIVAILLFTIFIEHLLLFFNKNREFHLSYSAISTSIGIIVLLYSSYLWVYFIAIFFALFQKHFLLLEGRHIFNPSNFAIVIILLLFYNKAHTITGQLGDELWLSMVVFTLAMAILVRVDRWIISLAFLGSYLLFQYYFIIFYDPTVIFEDIYRRLYSVTFMLFIYFMLTDPPVTPNSRWLQLLYGVSTALLVTMLDRFYGYRVQHLFMVVFFLSYVVSVARVKEKQKHIKMIVILLLAVLFILGYIEYQEPYYFEMNG